MWRKRLRIGIALFVVAFAAIVAMSLRRPPVDPKPTETIPRRDVNSVTESGSGVLTRIGEGKTKLTFRFGRQITYEDGRSKLMDGVKLTLPDRDGRTIEIAAREATVNNPQGAHQVTDAAFNQDVTLTTSDGITVKSATATYNGGEGVARVPGPVTFSRGRMTGEGVGATYDNTHNVLSILAQAKVDVGPDETGGGVMHITAATANLARSDHFMKFTGAAHMQGDDRTIDADDATVFLSPDDKLVQRMELRGHSKLTGTGNAPQSMEAQDIDLAYGPDGRALQSANLREQSAVQLPGEAGKPGRRIAGRTIDIAMAPDGATVTNLTSKENVQVDLPAEGDVPARRIRAALLAATGAPTTGLRDATFTGAVDFRESRPAVKNAPAIDRTARAERLVARTQPGFGNLERAEFHNAVHFTDGTDTTADAPFAIYDVTGDRLDLSPGSGHRGAGPHVVDAQFTVDARTVSMQLSAQKLTAETAVRSEIKPQKPGAQGDVKVPSMLKPDQPVYVTSKRLAYDSGNERGVYSGDARLWQEDTVIQSDTIEMDNKTGNLHARAKVRSQMYLTETDEQTKKQQKTLSIGKADDLLYEDAKHRATYTGTASEKAHLTGPQGDVTGRKIDVYLAEKGGELERLEADEDVTVVENTRTSTGKHLTYIAAKEQYTMVGAPVVVIDNTPPNCKKTLESTLTFYRTTDTISGSGNGVYPLQTQTIPCGGSEPRP
jgi:lipopolysaccharide export system protein LptA